MVPASKVWHKVSVSSGGESSPTTLYYGLRNTVTVCERHAPRFELHGHGYGPLWWQFAGVVVECLTKPYEQPLISLQQRSSILLQIGNAA